MKTIVEATHRHWDARLKKYSYISEEKLTSLRRRDEPIYENDVILFEYQYRMHKIQWYKDSNYQDWFDQYGKYISDKVAGGGFWDNTEDGFIGIVGMDCVHSVVYQPVLARPDLIKIDTRAEMFSRIKTVSFHEVGDCYVISNLNDHPEVKNIWEL